jgi:hypothetical protein
MEQEIQNMGKRLQTCVAETENRKQIIDLFMCHLKWHPLTHLCSTPEVARRIDRKEVWEQQTEDMHNLCFSLSEGWAWEYLWRSW